ncbi:uncharacterized protein LOC119402757 isoform X3 [Rhipicephalus sanguineus]|uniref:uncharacterized protein LOC119402757 isoform X3 n=1 Tax=Rhipicephalus sanguineus TaxID=34632 RepID=UPI0020C54083|nr:uncharacterized protein LOC119402757 isoform X3 [Rhipicephalus sanguineus]
MDTDDSQGAGCSADAKTTDKNEQQMYFDSGDYYMAKDKTRKAVLQVAPSIPTILQSPTGKIIPTVESVPSRNTSPVQSKLALEPSSAEVSKRSTLHTEVPTRLMKEKARKKIQFQSRTYNLPCATSFSFFFFALTLFW